MLALPAIDHPASLSRRSFSTAFDQILAQNARPIICFSAWDFMLDFVSLSSHPTLPQSPSRPISFSDTPHPTLLSRRISNRLRTAHREVKHLVGTNSTIMMFAIISASRWRWFDVT